MKVFKITLKNQALLSLNLPPLHFEEQRTAEAVVKTFNDLTTEGNTLEWEAEVIHVLSHEEALAQFTQGLDIVSNQKKK